MMVRKRRSMANLLVGGGLKTTNRPNSPDSFDPARSPTSPLDHHMGFSNLTTNPLILSPRVVDSPRKSWDSERVGLGLVDTLVDGFPTRAVLFGSQMRSDRAPKIQEVSSNDALQTMSCTSDAEDFAHNTSPSLTPTMGGYLSASDVEMSEDYTRITTHGPHPKTTHIFGDCVFQGGNPSCSLKIGEGSSSSYSSSSSSSSSTTWLVKCEQQDFFPSMVGDDFLSSCYACKKKLGDRQDIYMYRGEKAFCSYECRDREISMEESKEEMFFEEISLSV